MKKKGKFNYEYNCDNHTTSPFANSRKINPKSKVTIPSEDDVRESKDWVDFNEK